MIENDHRERERESVLAMENGGDCIGGAIKDHSSDGRFENAAVDEDVVRWRNRASHLLLPLILDLIR